MAIKYIIPARRNSKGFPFKNRKLFKYTLNNIPHNCHHNVIVTTDDEEIIKICKTYGLKHIYRPEHLACDEANTRDVLIHAIESVGMGKDDIVCMLYLTYPQRTWEFVTEFLDCFIHQKAKSMLCGMDPLTHPYLCMYEFEGGSMQVVHHDLYRRQDYPPVFEISHFCFASYVSELYHLNKNLYNERTLFYNIERPIDIDYEKEFKEYEDSISNPNGR
ncbi:MAG: hypothetical protein JSW06_02710 [Thermoplasmatales archaeon]|nr:MAG: hypothetical protein JSW06_02710 [Thermoplasmatales archaeon]